MSNVIKLKRSSTINSAPTTSDLEFGEVAVNSADKKIYMRDGENSITTIANFANVDAFPYGDYGTVSESIVIDAFGQQESDGWDMLDTPQNALTTHDLGGL